MFQKIRREVKALPDIDAVTMFDEASYGTLSMEGIDGFPYGVPVNFVYDNGKIIFHSAVAGKKYESLIKNPNVSFTVVAQDDVQPAKFTTLYRSAMAFGKARLLEDESEITKAMEHIVEKYSFDHMEKGKAFIKEKMGSFCVFEMEILHMTAKGSPLKP